MKKGMEREKKINKEIDTWEEVLENGNATDLTPAQEVSVHISWKQTP